MNQSVQNFNLLAQSISHVQSILDGEVSKPLKPLYGHPVDLADAKLCHELLQNLVDHPTHPLPGFPNINWQLVESKFSYGFSFQGKDLSTWIQQNVTPPNVDEIRIVLGLYTPSYVQKHNLPNNFEWRLTAFLWLYNSAQPNTPISKPSGNDAYNLGGLHP